VLLSCGCFQEYRASFSINVLVRGRSPIRKFRDNSRVLIQHSRVLREARPSKSLRAPLHRMFGCRQATAIHMVCWAQSPMSYQTLKSELGVPIKAWVQGVPLEDAARKQLLYVSQLPFIFKWVAAMPDVHWGIGATVGSVIPTRARSFLLRSASTSAAA
jgi:tRNA-splicing ligase RtcB